MIKKQDELATVVQLDSFRKTRSKEATIPDTTLESGVIDLIDLDHLTIYVDFEEGRLNVENDPDSAAEANAQTSMALGRIGLWLRQSN